MSNDLACKMESILNTWKSSGESLLAFSKKSEIPYTKLCYWNRRLKSPTRKRRVKKKEPAMTPVHIVPTKPAEQASPTLEVVFSNDIKLAVTDGFDAAEARRLIEVLRSC